MWGASAVVIMEQSKQVRILELSVEAVTMSAVCADIIMERLKQARIPELSVETLNM